MYRLVFVLYYNLWNRKHGDKIMKKLVVKIEWGMTYLFGPAPQQDELVECLNESEAKWIIEEALNSGAERAIVLDLKEAAKT